MMHAHVAFVLARAEQTSPVLTDVDEKMVAMQRYRYIAEALVQAGKARLLAPLQYSLLPPLHRAPPTWSWLLCATSRKNTTEYCTED